MKKIYLDNAATTPIDPRVLKAMLACYAKIYGNAGSLHEKGREANVALSEARKNVAKILNCKPQEIVFTGSGTESDNIAILGVAHANKDFGNHIVLSNIEHNAVFHPLEKLQKEGFKTDFLKVNKEGLLEASEIKKAVTDNTILVSIMYANNEIGTIQPIKEIGRAIKEVREDRARRRIKTPIYFHTDACQAAGYLDLDVQKLGVDLLTLNGSKIYGPKGTGILYVKAGTKIEPIVFGGGQEQGIRSGTENIPGIVGLAEALKIASKNREKESKRETKLRDYFIKEILKNIPRVVLNGHPQKRLPNNVNISVLDIEGEAMLLWLDKYGIFVSTGSACDSRSLDPSHVILALGRPYEYANGNLRFTLGRLTTKKDIDYVLKVLPKIIRELRKISPLRVEDGRSKLLNFKK
jgi:cysteine desulfurase